MAPDGSLIHEASKDTVTGAFHSPGVALICHWTDSILALEINDATLEIAFHTWLVDEGLLIANSRSLSTALFIVSF